MKKAGSHKPLSKAKSSRPATRKTAGERTHPRPSGRRASPAKSAKAAPKRAAKVASRNAAAKVAIQPAPIRKRQPTPEEIQYQKNIARFEHAVKVFNQGDFSKAREMFEPLSGIPSQDLAQRVRVYLSICDRRLAKPVLRLKTADDYYNYAVSMANQGNREEAENNLIKALKLAPQCDYIYYALATTQALRDNVEGALENLQKAIALNAKNRYLAQNDADFEVLGEDPRFTELIYPEKPAN